MKGWKVGDRVGIGWHGGQCGYCHNCRRGDFFACLNEHLTTGVTFDGGYAEYLVAPASGLAAVPEGLGAVPKLEVPSLQMLLGSQEVRGWYSGTAADSEDGLNFSLLQEVRSMNEVYKLEQFKEGYERMMSGKARFRVVMTMD